MEDCTRDLCVRGFYVYRDICEAAEGKVLQGERETGSHEQLLLPVLWMKVSPLGLVSHPCNASIIGEPFQPRSVLVSPLL